MRTAGIFQSTGRWFPALFLAALATLAFTVYGSQLSAPLDSDARFLTVQNAFVLSPGGIGKIWTADFFEGATTHGVPYRSGYYRPVVNALFWAEFRVAGDSEVFYHIIQVLLHVLNAFLVFGLIGRIFHDRRAGVLAALLFALHPVHAFAASQPAARADVLFPTFYLLAIVFFDAAITGRPGPGLRWKVALTAVFYCLAVLSKEMGITLPAVLVLVVLLRRYRDGDSLRPLVWTVPIWTLMGVYVFWRFVILNIPPPVVGYSDAYPDHVLFLGGLRSLAIHASRVMLPLGPTYPELNPTLANFLSSPFREPLTYISIATAGALALAALTWKRHPAVAFWSGFLLVTFSPLMRINNIAGSLGNNVILTEERWFYLPSIAIIAPAGLALAALLRQASDRRTTLALMGFVAILLVGLGYSASVHAESRTDPFARLRQLYLFPEDRLSRLERANKLMLYAQWVALPMGELEEAETRARAAVAIVPDSPISAVALGHVLSERQKWNEVIDVVEPWMNPESNEMRRFGATNPRVGDDLNRVSSRIPFLLARAYAHTEQDARAPALFCESAQRGFDIGTIRATWQEIFPGRDLTCQLPGVGR